MRSVNPAEVNRTESLGYSATLLTIRRWTPTVHAPPTHVQLFTIAVIEATFEIMVVCDIVNRIRIILGPSTAMAAGKKGHDCQ